MSQTIKKEKERTQSTDITMPNNETKGFAINPAQYQMELWTYNNNFLQKSYVSMGSSNKPLQTTTKTPYGYLKGSSTQKDSR